jgi:hypothetical protein
MLAGADIRDRFPEAYAAWSTEPINLDRCEWLRMRKVQARKPV